VGRWHKRGCPLTAALSGAERLRRSTGASPPILSNLLYSVEGRNGVQKFAVISMIALTLCSSQLLGYEDDVHYGLTKWLALQAGLTAQEAEWMASEDVGYDHSVLSAPYLVTHYACIHKDAKASGLVQEKHFPGLGFVPCKQSRRLVVPGRKEARRKTADRIANPSASTQTDIRKFGEGLHPFQDSWSHQGQSDSPLPLVCDSDYSWGHPGARGGWKSHKADLTADYPSDAMEMARESYDQICRFADVVLHRPCKAKFSSFAGDVEAFVKAKKKSEKRAWFQSHGIADTTFLDDVSLPDGPRYARAGVGGGKLNRSESQKYRRAISETEEGKFMLSFFERWVTGTGLSDLTTGSITSKGFRYLSDGNDANELMDRESLSGLLKLWLVRDHGSVAEALHDVRVMRKVGVLQLVRATESMSRPYETVEEALLPLDPAGTRIDVTRLDTEGSAVAYGVVRFRHAPRDTVMVVAGKEDGRYRVKAIASFVEY